MKTIDKQEVLRKIAIKEKRLVELERLEQQSYKMMMKYSRSGNLLRKKIAKLNGASEISF